MAPSDPTPEPSRGVSGRQFVTAVAVVVAVAVGVTVFWIWRQSSTTPPATPATRFDAAIAACDGIRHGAAASSSTDLVGLARPLGTYVAVTLRDGQRCLMTQEGERWIDVYSSASPKPTLVPSLPSATN